jgi:hypothetical protein
MVRADRVAHQQEVAEVGEQRADTDPNTSEQRDGSNALAKHRRGRRLAGETAPFTAGSLALGHCDRK